jgi:phosphonatase-like hydrolase
MRGSLMVPAGAFPSLVIFDLAGTTVRDSGQVPAALAEALTRSGISITSEQLVNVRGASKKEAIRTFIPDGPGQAQRVEEAYSSFQRGLARRYRGGVTAVEGAERTFDWLRARGVRIAFNTGFDRMITDLLLAALAWSRDIASTVVCGDDVARGRPAPDLILQAMKRLQVTDPARVANVGDTTLDLAAGHRAEVGWNIGVLTGAHDLSRLTSVPHTHILDSVADLPRLLDPEPRA